MIFHNGGLMTNKDDLRLLIDIAQMYYSESATQDDVAKRFNISRSLVSKYLSRAKDLGIVEIRVHDELFHPYKQLEEKLKKKFDLENVVCVNAADPSQVKQRIGDATAKFLSKVIQPDSIIGVSAGTTVYEVASNMYLNVSMNNLTFVPLVGGLGKEHTDIQANVVCDIFARRTGGVSVDLHVPVLVDSANAKEVLLAQNFIKKTFDLMKRVDIALVGIGGAPVYDEMTKAYLHKVDPTALENKDRVTGDICYNFFDKHGRYVDTDWNRRVMAIDLDEIKKIPLVIGAAGGLHKVEGIRAALKGQLVNVLITDINTARELLKEE